MDTRAGGFAPVPFDLFLGGFENFMRNNRRRGAGDFYPLRSIAEFTDGRIGFAGAADPGADGDVTEGIGDAGVGGIGKDAVDTVLRPSSAGRCGDSFFIESGNGGVEGDAFIGEEVEDALDNLRLGIVDDAPLIDDAVTEEPGPAEGECPFPGFLFRLFGN